MWRSREVFNSCSEQKGGPITTETSGNELNISDGGFGYTSPQTISIQVFDLGNCNTESEVFAVENPSESENKPELCQSFDIEFNE